MIDTIDAGKRTRLIILLIIGGLVVAGLLVGRAVSDRKAQERADRAVAGIDQVLRERGPALVEGYPLNAEEIGAAFARVDGATFVAALEHDGALRLAFESRWAAAARCLRYDVAADGGFTHETVKGDCS